MSNMRVSEVITGLNGQRYRFVPSDFPNWYGISGIKFVYHNNWADPDIVYRGKLLNSHIVEDTMWEEYTTDDDGNIIREKENDLNGFSTFMLEQAEHIKELFLLAFGEGPLAL